MLKQDKGKLRKTSPQDRPPLCRHLQILTLFILTVLIVILYVICHVNQRYNHSHPLTCNLSCIVLAGVIGVLQYLMTKTDQNLFSCDEKSLVMMGLAPLVSCLGLVLCVWFLVSCLVSSLVPCPLSLVSCLFSGLLSRLLSCLLSCLVCVSCGIWQCQLLSILTLTLTLTLTLSITMTRTELSPSSFPCTSSPSPSPSPTPSPSP